jgi:hypothetical protein
VSVSRIRLLDADPDLGQFLRPEELAEARQLTVPSCAFGRDEEAKLHERLMSEHAFAVLILDGMVLEEIQIGDQLGMRLLGPGDIVSRNRTQSMLVTRASTRMVVGTRVAMLGREVLLATRRWPALMRGFHLRDAQQADRIATQLVVCQLPRVDQRLLAVMWLLAESWGRVTPAGTTLPLKLTHDVLGALVGARRPTVTLAVRDLTERGAILRQDRGWLLLEPPAGASRPFESLRSPSLIEDRDSVWADNHVRPVPTVQDEAALDLLLDRLAGLRERHEAERVAFAERMRTLAQVREDCRASRSRVVRDRVRRRRSRPS